MRVVKDDETGEVIGCCQLQLPGDVGMLDLPEDWRHKPEEGEAYVEWIAATRTGQGVGSSLLRWANAFALEQGCDRITLMVMQKNEGGVRLYERKGYVIKPHHEASCAACPFIFCFMGCTCQSIVNKPEHNQ